MQLHWMNVFQLCKFLKVVGNLMVLVVIALLTSSYYSVVGLTLIPALKDDDRGWLRAVYGTVIGLYTVVMGMIVWSYFATLTQEPGSVPGGWHPFADEETALREFDRWEMYGDTIYNRADPRRPRYCVKCGNWKPERTHHCSVSGKCILRMDHYCIWVVNCVGLLNYKFFLLFLAYTWVGCLLSVGILLPSLVKMVKAAEQDWGMFIFMTSILDAVFVISLLGFLCMHLKLLSVNCTSIEMYEKQRVSPWPFDLGFARNLEQVLGRNKWLWVLPMFSAEDKTWLLENILSPRLVTLDNVE